jgi:hypothetical protein
MVCMRGNYASQTDYARRDLFRPHNGLFDKKTQMKKYCSLETITLKTMFVYFDNKPQGVDHP